MQSRSLISMVATVMTVAFVSLPATPSHAEPSKCAAAKVKAAAKEASAKAKCHFAALKSDTAVDPTCLSKAEEKFDAAFVKADAADLNCPNLNDGSDVEAIVDEFVDALVAQVVAVPTCTDGVANGTETDVDCGGSCNDCALGDGCALPADCASGACEGNVCALRILPLSCSSDEAWLIPVPGPAALGGECPDSECYTCGTPSSSLTQTGPEDIFAFECQVTGTVTVSFSNITAACNLDFYAMEATPTPFECIAGSTGPSAMTGSLSFSCTAGTDYFVVVENPSGASCDYQISVQAGAGSGCREDCDDGLDNDGNGDTDGADVNCAP
jgi:hypothetical protein